MTEEEYFIKHYPDFCYYDKPLSPYWDLFQYGVEFGERQSEKRIEELTSELAKKADTNHSLVEQMADLESENAELNDKLDNWVKCAELRLANWQKYEKQLTKAKELIKLFVQWNYGCCKIPDLKDIVKQAEQFLEKVK